MTKNINKAAKEFKDSMQDMVDKSEGFSTRAEYRNILCEVIVDETKNEVYWIRQDTNEIVNRESPIPVRYSQPELSLDTED